MKKIFLYFALFVFVTSCGHKKDKQQGTGADSVQVENTTLSKQFIHDTLLTIMQVKKSDAYIDSLTNHKQGISFMIGKPQQGKESLGYQVQAGYNSDVHFETYYFFYINPANKEIKVLDQTSGNILPLQEWQKQNP
jgi:hypothetical protein